MQAPQNKIHNDFLSKQYLLFIFIAILFVSACNNKQQSDELKSEDISTVLPPTITNIDELPDSNKPIEFLLSNVPKPITINTPTNAGGTYSINKGNSIQKINLLPPAVHNFINPITKLPIDVGLQGALNFTTYTSNDGLALDAVNSGMSDKKGNIWFSTVGGGASKYDGKSFTNYTTDHGLANNNVRSIYEDRKGNIWFATQEGGISKYDGKAFTTFTMAHGMASNDASYFLEDKKGILWIGTNDNGVCKYDGKTFSSISKKDGLIGNEVVKIFEDNANNLWFGTSEGLSKYDGKTFTSFTDANGLAGNAVMSIAQDHSDNIWIGTLGKGVSKYNGKTFTNYSTQDGLAGNIIMSILIDEDGIIWFGTFNDGLSRYDGKSFTTFSVEQGLAGKSVWSIIQDNSSSLWFSTYDGGVSKFDKNSITTFSTNQGLGGNIVRSIAEDKSGNLWFGTIGGGVSKYNGHSFTSYTTAQGLSDNNVRSILQDKKGNIWFGTYGNGVSKFDGKSFTTYGTEHGLPSTAILSMIEDKHGNFWFGTRNGVSYFNGKSFKNYTKKQSTLGHEIYCITEDHFGNIWFGTQGEGIATFNGTILTSFTTKQGLSNNEVQSIKADALGNLWIGTMGGGLDLINKENLKAIHKGTYKPNKNLFINFSTIDSLPGNMITQIVESDEGMYIGTKSGICELEPSATSAKGWRVGQVYNSETGYSIKDVNSGQNALFKDSKGILWIATGSNKTALIRFDPKSIKRNKRIPLVAIKKIKINNESISWYDLLTDNSKPTIDSNSTPSNITEEVNTYGRILSDKERLELKNKFAKIQFDGVSKWFSLPTNLCLPFSNNNVSFEFNAIQTDRNFLVQYSFILEGYNKDWSPPSNNSVANFGNIFEGTYTFRLKARNPQGIWSNPISYTFTVHPPWWRTWWMYVTYFLLAISLIGGYITWSQRKLKHQNILLEHKVEVAVKEMREEKDKSEELLLNILPAEVADELKLKGSSTAKNFDQVTILFTDFQNFTNLSEKMSAQELVNEIDYCYSAFDNIITKHNIEKIKTIGDSYMCAGGLPLSNKTNPEDAIRAALEIRDFITQEKIKRQAEGLPFFEIRIGINTGPVVAGIVGIKKFAYDIWGDSVNIASRMESSGVPGKVNISGNTYELVKDKFNCASRGKIEAKNKGMIEMYFVEHKSA